MRLQERDAKQGAEHAAGKDRPQLASVAARHGTACYCQWLSRSTASAASMGLPKIFR